MSANRKNIAIIGSSPESFRDAPWEDDGWEIWGMNDCHPILPRWTRWFQLHAIDDLDFEGRQEYVGPAGHLKWLMAQKKPVYLMPPDHQRVPAGHAYPRDAMVTRYGTTFLNCTAAYMMALAIEEAPQKIGLWCCDMAAGTEYYTQRFGVRFFQWVAREQGIDIVIPETSELAFEPPPYPEVHPRQALVLRRLEVARTTLESQRAEARVAESNTILLNGRIQEIDDHAERISDYKERRATLEAERDRMGAAFDDAMREVVLLSGKVDELTHQAMNWTNWNGEQP